MAFDQSSFNGGINPSDPSRQRLQEIAPAIGPCYISATPFWDRCIAVLSNTTPIQDQERANRVRQCQALLRSHYILSAPAVENTNSQQESNKVQLRRDCSPTMGLFMLVPSSGHTTPHPGEYHGQWLDASMVKQEPEAQEMSFTIHKDVSDLGYELPIHPAVTSKESHHTGENHQLRDTDVEMLDSCADTIYVPGSDSTMSVEDLTI